jgi:hypothetical protein
VRSTDGEREQRRESVRSERERELGQGEGESSTSDFIGRERGDEEGAEGDR